MGESGRMGGEWGEKGSEDGCAVMRASEGGGEAGLFSLVTMAR